MKNLKRLCCQINLKSTKLINMFTWKTQIKVMLLYISMEDMLILSSNDHMIISTKKILTKQVWHERLGCCNVILGINISRTSDELILSQSYYVEKVLEKKFGLFFYQKLNKSKCSPL